METWLIPLLVSIITALSIVIPGIYAANRQARKDRTDAAATVQDMAIQLIEPLENRIVKLEKKIKDLEQERDDLKDWAERLCCQVRDLGGTPVKFEEKARSK